MPELKLNLSTPRPKNFEDPNLVPPDDALKAIGYIAVVAAGIEDHLHSLFWKYATLSDVKGPIITAEMRPNRMMEDIIKLAQASNENPNRVSDLKSLFHDLKELTLLRNQCIHWIWEKSDGITHQVAAPSYKGNRPPLELTTAEMNGLAQEMAWIEVRLAPHCLTDQAIRKARNRQQEPNLYAPAPWLDQIPPRDPKHSPLLEGGK